MALIFLPFLIFVMSSSSWAVNLEQAVQSTLQKNETLGQSRLQLQQVEELGQQTRGAIYPHLSLSGTYLLQPELKDPTLAQLFPKEQKTVNATLTQPLFRGFREFAAVRRQDNYYRAQQQIYLKQMIQTYQDVAQSYMDVLALEQDIRNIEAQKKIYQTRVKDLQARVRRGESSSSETLTAQSTAAALDAEFQMQTSRLRSAREKFSILTSLPVNTELTDISDKDVQEPLKPLEAYLAGIEERPDIKEQKEKSQAAEEDVSIARGAHWPTADLLGNYYFLRPDTFPEESKWDVQLRVSFPLFEGGVTQSQVRTAALKKGETDLALSQLRRTAEAEVRTLHESLRLRSDQLKYLKLSSDLSEKNYQTLLRDSRRGLVRSIDVQLGLTEYRLAKRTYDQARYEARLERIRLDLAAAMIPSILTKDLK